MELGIDNTKLTKVSDIKIPDIFNRRLKSGINKIDVLFDEGILPGSAMTLTAKAGCGKTTFMLQVLNGLTKNGYKVGYFSGEESIYQLAFTANRINATQVSIANETDIDTICAYMEQLDLIVVDSFQALTSKKKLNSRALEKYAVQTLTKHAKKTECTIVFIMHLTKSGDLKGSTIVPHTVDANLKIDRVADVDEIIYSTKVGFSTTLHDAVYQLLWYVIFHVLTIQQLTYLGDRGALFDQVFSLSTDVSFMQLVLTSSLFNFALIIFFCGDEFLSCHNTSKFVGSCFFHTIYNSNLTCKNLLEIKIHNINILIKHGHNNYNH